MAKSLRTVLAVAFRFLRGRRGGATGFAAAAVVMMLLGGGALISDHVWLVGKRDLLQSAAAAASVATTQRLATLPGSMTDADVHAELLPVAERYARLNVLANVGKELVPDDVTVVLAVDRATGTVDVRVSADIGDTLLSKWLYDYGGPGDMAAHAGAEYESVPAEVVLAIDTTNSMNRSYPGARSRLAAVKAAAKNLVDILQPSEASGVAVGIVPWTIMVRLGSEARATWHTEGWVEFPSQRRYVWPYLRTVQRSVPPAVVQDIPAAVRGTWHGCVGASRIEDGIAEIPARDDALVLPEDTPFAEYYFASHPGVSYECFSADQEPSDLYYQECWDRSTVRRGTTNFSPAVVLPGNRTERVQQDGAGGATVDRPARHRECHRQPGRPGNVDPFRVRSAVGEAPSRPDLARGVGRFGAPGGPGRSGLRGGAQGSCAPHRRGRQSVPFYPRRLRLPVRGAGAAVVHVRGCEGGQHRAVRGRGDGRGQHRE